MPDPPGVVGLPRLPLVYPDPLELLQRFPAGWSRAAYAGRTWGVSRTSSVDGRVQRVYAEALAGEDGEERTVVSANLYRVGDRTELRPCEMPAEVVLDFLAHAEPDGPSRRR